MSVSDKVRRRRKNELAECFAVIDTCLGAYYSGAKHMYRPLAGQLRILICDKPPLLSRVDPNLRIGALRSIEWLEPPAATLFPDTETRLVVDAPRGQEFRLARMPFVITEYENGLQVADLAFDASSETLPLDDWMEQSVTVYPSKLSLRAVIRSIADKGGGAHVDDKINAALRDMQVTGPSGVGMHVLFSVAVGRCAQQIGLRYGQFFKRSGSTVRPQDVADDVECPLVNDSAKVFEELEAGRKNQFVLTALMRVR